MLVSFPFLLPEFLSREEKDWTDLRKCSWLTQVSVVGTDAVMGKAQISFHSALYLDCFSHQIYTLLFATGNLECGDVCNLWAAETGLDECPDATRISILNRSGHLDATGTKSVKNGIKQWVHARRAQTHTCLQNCLLADDSRIRRRRGGKSLVFSALSSFFFFFPSPFLQCVVLIMFLFCTDKVANKLH